MSEGQKIWDHKLFILGNWNYGYENQSENNWNFARWLAITVGTLGIDYREAAIVLGGGILAQEYLDSPYPGASTDQPPEKTPRLLYSYEEMKNDPSLLEGHNHGSSWVHNVQSGYLLYHVAFNSNRRLIVGLPLVWELFADFQNWHPAHFYGLAQGCLAGFLLQRLFGKKKILI